MVSFFIVRRFFLLSSSLFSNFICTFALSNLMSTDEGRAMTY